MLEQISTWTEMDFPVWRNGFTLVQIVTRRRQPVVSALKGQPTITAPHAVTNAFSLCHCMVRIHNGRDPRQRRRTQLPKQAVNMFGHTVEVKGGIHLFE